MFFVILLVCLFVYQLKILRKDNWVTKRVKQKTGKKKIKKDFSIFQNFHYDIDSFKKKSPNKQKEQEVDKKQSSKKKILFVLKIFIIFLVQFISKIPTIKKNFKKTSKEYYNLVFYFLRSFSVSLDDSVLSFFGSQFWTSRQERKKNNPLKNIQ